MIVLKLALSFSFGTGLSPFDFCEKKGSLTFLQKHIVALNFMKPVRRVRVRVIRVWGVV